MGEAAFTAKLSRLGTLDEGRTSRRAEFPADRGGPPAGLRGMAPRQRPLARPRLKSAGARLSWAAESGAHDADQRPAGEPQFWDRANGPAVWIRGRLFLRSQ